MKTIGWIFLFFPLFTVAQETGKPAKLYPRFILGGGSVAGASGVKPMLQLSGGLSYAGYFAGVGLGYESYRFNSYPLFADLRAGIGEKRAVYAYAHTGYNFPGSHSKVDYEFYQTSDKLKGGFYMDVGFGYRLPVGKMQRFSLSTGYSRKNMVWQKGYTYPCFNQECDETFYLYRYSFGRIVTRLSWELGR